MVDHEVAIMVDHEVAIMVDHEVAIMADHEVAIMVDHEVVIMVLVTIYLNSFHMRAIPLSSCVQEDMLT